MKYKLERVGDFLRLIWNIIPQKNLNYEQEKARRRRQIEKGYLKECNGLIREALK